MKFYAALFVIQIIGMGGQLSGCPLFADEKTPLRVRTVRIKKFYAIVFLM